MGRAVLDVGRQRDCFKISNFQGQMRQRPAEFRRQPRSRATSQIVAAISAAPACTRTNQTERTNAMEMCDRSYAAREHINNNHVRLKYTSTSNILKVNIRRKERANRQCKSLAARTRPSPSQLLRLNLPIALPLGVDSCRVFYPLNVDCREPTLRCHAVAPRFGAAVRAADAHWA